AGVVLEVQAPQEPLRVPGDGDQLTQVFHNLIENAVKYGGAGKRVTVMISRDPRDLSLRGPAVRIDVIDRGEGIDAIHLPRLTERFYRVDSHRSREKGGTGLGLAIVKHIVNRHRGRFRIDSEKGKGSRFSIILPES
ncbi:two-component sensor histidine kinase, partial [Thioclava sp. BHET1]